MTLNLALYLMFGQLTHQIAQMTMSAATTSRRAFSYKVAEIKIAQLVSLVNPPIAQIFLRNGGKRG